MCDENEKSKSKKQLNSSKQLLYSDVMGDTVTEHVLSSLEKTTHTTTKRSESIKEFLKSRGQKSEALERGKRILSLVDENDKGSCTEASVDDEKAIEVHFEMNEESSDEETENRKFDAWFFWPQSKCKTQESEKDLPNVSDVDKSSDLDGDSSDLDDDSSDLDEDSSDFNYLQPFPSSMINKIVEEED